MEILPSSFQAGIIYSRCSPCCFTALADTVFGALANTVVGPNALLCLIAWWQVVESGALNGINHSNSIFFETERDWECPLSFI